MNYGLKEKIIKLREQGKTYNQIKKELNCSKGTISYHCSQITNNEKIRNTNKEKISFHKNASLNFSEETKNNITVFYNYGDCYEM